jgi:hypothetical protein
MSQQKFKDISWIKYDALVTFAEMSDRDKPMGRFNCDPVYVPETQEQPKQGGTYLCSLHHSCFGRFY